MASRAATGRAVAILLGLVLAMVAAFLLWRYVGAADQRAREGAELVDVFVATGGIPQGMTTQTAVAQLLLEQDQIPAENRPDTAITSLSEITGLAAASDIPAGAVIQSELFQDPLIVDTEFTLDEGQVAISLQVGVPEGVSGFLDQEDRVGVIANISAPADGPDADVGADATVEPAPDGAESLVTTSRYVTDATILAIGQRVILTDAEGNQADQVEQTGQVLVTLAVTPEDAERLVFASNQGSIHFTLLPPGGQTGDTPGATLDDLFAP